MCGGGATVSQLQPVGTAPGCAAVLSAHAKNETGTDIPGSYHNYSDTVLRQRLGKKNKNGRGLRKEAQGVVFLYEWMQNK